MVPAAVGHPRRRGPRPAGRGGADRRIGGALLQRDIPRERLPCRRAHGLGGAVGGMGHHGAGRRRRLDAGRYRGGAEGDDRRRGEAGVRGVWGVRPYRQGLVV